MYSYILDVTCTYTEYYITVYTVYVTVWVLSCSLFLSVMWFPVCHVILPCVLSHVQQFQIILI